MFIILIEVVVSWLYTYVQTYQIIHFKYVQFTVLQICLNANGREKYHQLQIQARNYEDFAQVTV